MRAAIPPIFLRTPQTAARSHCWHSRPLPPLAGLLLCTRAVRRMCARASALPPLPRAPSQPSYPTPSTPLRPFLQLHVFAKLAGETDDFAKVFVADGSDVGDLKKAIVTELKLDAAPNRVRLLLEVEGGRPLPLDSRKALAGQGVLEGASVVVEVMVPPVPLQAAPAAPPLRAHAMPAPLTFTREDVGGTPMMVAELAPPSAQASSCPFFMTLKEHYDLLRFLSIPSAPCPRSMSILPRMLMLTGTIKSGKSRILLDIIPRMLSAGHAAAARTPLPRRRPVIFSFTFSTHSPSDVCARRLVDALHKFARNENVPLLAWASRPVDQMVQLAADLAQCIHERGDELWLLLDELGAPIVASTAQDANSFIVAFKEMLEACWTQGAFLACSGSGMVSLLTAMRSCPPNGFMLWGTVTHLRLGSQPPSPAAALAMASRIHAFYSLTSWAGGRERVAAFITPERCVAALARASHGDATSPRPALVAYLLALTEDATRGSAEMVWRRALELLLKKLREESAHDAAVALERLPLQGLLALRQLADGSLSIGEQGDPHGKALDVLRLLCEEDGGEGAIAAPLLMPPYGALLRSWVTRDGRLAVSSRDGSGGLHLLARNNLKALHTLWPRFSMHLRDAISSAVLRVMVFYSIGTLEEGEENAGRRPGIAFRAPRTVEEFVSIPGIASLLAALEAQAAQQGQQGKATSVARLQVLLRTPPDSQKRADYMRNAGLWALLLLRHAESHLVFPSIEVERCGFTCAAITAIINAATETPLELEASTYSLKEGVLCAIEEEPNNLTRAAA